MKIVQFIPPVKLSSSQISTYWHWWIT